MCNLPYWIGRAFVDKVFPVDAESFPIAPMSPAISSFTSTGLFPSSTYSLLIFSSLSVSALYKVSSFLIDPEQTLIIEYFPMNGSTIVLKIYADFGFEKS